MKKYDWRLFLDDERWPADKDLDMIIARSYPEAVHKIAKYGMPKFISFDHDLGENQESGFDLAKWIVLRDMEENGQFVPKDFEFYVHSQNPIGAENIRRYLTQYIETRKKYGVITAG